MADEPPSTAEAEAEAESETQVTFTVKSSNDAKYTLTLPLTTTTVADLKIKLSSADLADISPARQRLIYSGRVLKDPDTLADCKLKQGNTIHLVKGAESNQRQTPVDQNPSATINSAGNVPTNIAAGTGANNPLAHLTGARYAGFHQLPGMDMFGADGGMGAPPSQDQILHMLEDPNYVSQISEAMNNPAVLDMMRNNPMIRDNPMARQVLENPEMRRLMFNPDMIRMQMNMQRSMGGGSEAANFPAPGVTETTQDNNTTALTNSPTDSAAPTTGANPFASLFGASAGAGPSQQGNPNPMGAMAQTMMQNPDMMRRMMQMMGGDAGGGPENPFAAFGGQTQQQQQPVDDRPPEDRYADQLRQLNDMGFFDFDRNIQALRRSGGSVQGAVEYLLSSPS